MPKLSTDKLLRNYLQVGSISAQKARGLIPGEGVVQKFGINSDIDPTSVPEDISGGSGLYQGFIEHADAGPCSIVSDSADDSAAGPGARTVRVSGINDSGVVTVETVTLNGTTPVSLANSYRRIFSTRVSESGSWDATNAGTITTTLDSDSSVFSVIPLFDANGVPFGTGESQQASFSTADDEGGLLKRLVVSIRRSGGTSATGYLWFKTEGNAPRYRYPFSVIGNDRYEQIIEGGLYLPPKTDVIVRITYVSATNANVQAELDVEKFKL